MSEELSTEDQLRLNVLLTQDIRAIRLEESRMELLALTDKGEASMPLHPTCRSDRYLRLVREALSGHALGSPGGYPVYLTRWTRHGQMESASLGKLLLTGEPEAVVAVVHSPALTDEIAAWAWWAMPSIENARLMLARPAVAQGKMGAVLADFLAEHLPFLQDDHLAIMDTIAVLIQSGCVTDETLAGVWRRGKRTNTYYVPFLEANWPGLSDVRPARNDMAALADVTRTLSDVDQALALWLARGLSAAGQAWVEAIQEILGRPETQEVVSRTLNAIGQYFSEGRPDISESKPLPEALQPWSRDLEAVTALASVNEQSVIPVFARSTAIGSLMRRKIEPVVAPILVHLEALKVPRV